MVLGAWCLVFGAWWLVLGGCCSVQDCMCVVILDIHGWVEWVWQPLFGLVTNTAVTQPLLGTRRWLGPSLGTASLQWVKCVCLLSSGGPGPSYLNKHTARQGYGGRAGSTGWRGLFTPCYALSLSQSGHRWRLGWSPGGFHTPILFFCLWSTWPSR